MRGARPARLAWTGGLLGLLLALVFFAPARWLAAAASAVTGGQLQLLNARGTVWDGQADLLLTGGDGSRSQTALPQGLHWQLRPAWVDGAPAARLSLSAPCCTRAPLQLVAGAGWRGAQLRVERFQSQWPAELLTGLGTPWNTLRFEGRLELNSPGFTLAWAAGRQQLSGAVDIQAFDLASRLSTLRPLGSYRLALEAPSGGDNATLALQTLRGDLQLQGQGQWVGGRLRFRGEAMAVPGREAALANLLNIIGRRQGERSLLNIG